MGPSAEEAQYYRELIETFDEAQKNGKAAINFQDKMVDIAAYRRAKKII
jgi:citrate lyase beta subunit